MLHYQLNASIVTSGSKPAPYDLLDVHALPPSLIHRELNMAIPSFLQGESLVRLLQGCALGAVLAMFLGFNWGGWILGSTAEKQANKQAKTAVVSVLAPICVDKFQASEDNAANLASLNEQSQYKRTGFVEDGGWAIMPGSEKSGDGVAKACAKLLTEL